MSNEILKIQEIVKNYDALIIDIWGVIYDGVDPYPGAIECLNSFIEAGKRIIFLSNNPRPYTFTKGKFEQWGVDMQKASLYTSGDAVREQLVAWNDEVFKNLGRKLYHLGRERNQDILSGLDTDITDDINSADFLLITAYVDENEDFNKHDALLKEAAELGLPAICANPDTRVHQGNMLRYCAGSFGHKYEALGGEVHYYGKPDQKIYDLVFKRYLNDIDKSKVLMIGDTMETDILGATRANIDSLLLMTGNGDKIAAKIAVGHANPFEGYSYKPTWLSYGMGAI